MEFIGVILEYGHDKRTLLEQKDLRGNSVSDYANVTVIQRKKEVSHHRNSNSTMAQIKHQYCDNFVDFAANQFVVYEKEPKNK